MELSPEAGGPILHDALAPYVRSQFLSPMVRRFFHLGAGSTLDDYVSEARRHPMFELQARPTSAADSTGR